MPEPVLTTRALNRALLGRQLLLARSTLPIVDAIEHVVGLQAQLPLNPYTGLWSRLVGFDPHALGRLVEERAVVRAAVMRSTIHLVSAADALRLRPVVQPVFDRELQQNAGYRAALAAIDPDRLAAIYASVRALLEAEPRTATEIRAHLAEHFPDVDPAGMAYACRNNLDVVQVPPRGVWGRSGQVRTTTLPHWLGRPLDASATNDDLVLRYLAAFGPATVADISTWSRLQGQREVVDRLRPQLRTYRNEAGQELFDVPDGLLPDPEVPAPVRILPEYDNAWLSHADRSRCFPSEEVRQRIWATAGSNGTVHGTVAHDGCAVATWRFVRSGTKAEPRTTLAVDHATKLTKAARTAIEAEGRAYLGFHEPEGTAVDVAFTSLP